MTSASLNCAFLPCEKHSHTTYQVSQGTSYATPFYRSRIFFSPLLTVIHTGDTQAVSHRQNHMWLCISKATLVFSVVCSPQCLSIWTRIPGSHFKPACFVPDIKDTILNYLTMKSLHIFRWILKPLCLEF